MVSATGNQARSSRGARQTDRARAPANTGSQTKRKIGFSGAFGSSDTPASSRPGLVEAKHQRPRGDQLQPVEQGNGGGRGRVRSAHRTARGGGWGRSNRPPPGLRAR